MDGMELNGKETTHRVWKFLMADRIIGFYLFTLDKYPRYVKFGKKREWGQICEFLPKYLYSGVKI